MISKDVITFSITGKYQGIDVPGVRFAFVEDDELIFYADHGEQALPLVKDALSEGGARVNAMSIRRPSLDDVFLHLVGAEEDSSPFNLSKFRNVTGRRG